ncbi:ML domain-containing protein [Aspergillus glaucus CBS 516.65]|uniref:Phosphatidylglycerol/phosphatidylinositol transfer protein n=1 Tax=Aspergillus glaucus CBS 516.65 TaxID=1160497 RepID=A0A1L9VEV1_ASPGL|nr:hypothetical protein ASPGLDRAFT_49135 [Aspergillus glaucus CBS 516.65]OJJ82352.1 hypothetical protein ASPGLDRAFT_49135 [Aspergillus glaucus CBS 516.65]
MKFLSATAALFGLLAPVSAAGSLQARAPAFFDISQTPIKTAGDIPVKGNNPLTYCADPSSYSLDIKSVDLTPNPPLPGKTLVIEAAGTLHERIEEGATVLLEVKYGLITLIRQTADLCEQIENVDLHCPLEKGDMVLKTQVDLPKQIPPGKYSVHADVYNNDEKQVTCLEAQNIEFKFKR